MNTHPNDFEDSLSAPTQSQEPRPGWFKRNWLWLIPTIILLPIFCCCGGGGALIYFGLGKVLDIAPYKDSVALIEQDPAVQQSLGTPVVAPKGFTDLIAMMRGGGQFNFNQTNSQMSFDAEVPVSGPNDSGMLRIQAESQDGVNWTYTIREIKLNDGTVIDLLPAGTISPSGGASTDENIDAAIKAIQQTLEEEPTE